MKFIYLLLANSENHKHQKCLHTLCRNGDSVVTNHKKDQSWHMSKQQNFELIKAGTHQATCQCKRIAATSHSLCAGEMRKCATICRNKWLDFCNLFFHKFPLHRQRFSQTFCQYTQSILSLTCHRKLLQIVSQCVQTWLYYCCVQFCFSMPDELFQHKHRGSCGVDGSLIFTVNLKFMSWTCYDLHASLELEHISKQNSAFLKLHYTTLY